MGMGPRKKDNDVRDEQCKMVNPKGPKGDMRSNASSGAGASGMKVAQDKATGKKYSGPHYPQKDKGIKPFGGK
jgi:hypothetical protein